ncbi:Nedd4 e3 ubiquitin-protein ligase wwp1, partial [Globisporangium polare]
MATTPIATALANPGFTVRFMEREGGDSASLPSTRTAASVDTDTTEAAAAGPPAAFRPNGPRKPAPIALESVKTALTHEVAAFGLQLTVSPDASPSELAVQLKDSTTPEAVNWAEALQLASQDFPTKYAHFVSTTASLIAPRSNEFVTISVSRDGVLHDSMRYLSSIPRQYVRSAMRIRFLDERGIDAGGLQREWFALLSEQLASPGQGVLRCVNKEEQTFYLNPQSQQDIGDDHLVYYYGTGRLIGRALLEEQVWGFHLALPLLKIILGLPVTFSDLEYFDPEAYASLVWIRDNDGVDDLGLTFSMTELHPSGSKDGSTGGGTPSGGVTVVDLVENGRDVPVTDDNKLAYLDLRFRYVLFESVSSQLYAFLKGLYEVIPQELLVLLDPEEFDLLLCGSDAVDVDDWEKHTTFTDDLRESDTKKWFWELVREMSNEYRRRLLHFATGSSRVPLTGFSAMTSFDGQLSPFTLHGAKLSEGEY